MKGTVLFTATAGASLALAAPQKLYNGWNNGDYPGEKDWPGRQGPLWYKAGDEKGAPANHIPAGHQHPGIYGWESNANARQGDDTPTYKNNVWYQSPSEKPGYGSIKTVDDIPDVLPKEILEARSQAVTDAFELAWNSYYEFAFPNDELRPEDNTFDNTRNGWGATAADALSTAIIHGLPDIVEQIVDYIPSIDWSVSNDDQVVSVFETNIRYLGGILSGYDLLTGPAKGLLKDQSKVPLLLEQAVNLANNLSFAFETPSGIPFNNLVLSSRSSDDETNGLATAGTLILEWTRLADLTGNDTYAELVAKTEDYLVNPTPSFAEPFPGLVGTNINITTGEFIDADGGWNGGTDSFYEYLIKMYVYDPSRFEYLRDRWILAADSTIANLASNPSSRPDLTFLAEYSNTTTINTSGHLACFDGGNFILAGLVLGEQKYTDFGLELVEGCQETYQQTLTGIGPDGFSWNASAVPDNQQEFYERAGFYITSGAYLLRPEVIESFYYAYRATGDVKYQEYVWNAFLAVNATTAVGSGYSYIDDVNAPGGGGNDNLQDSFFLAETLKYSYLAFSEDAAWQVAGPGGSNEFVYNTEAHPVRVAGAGSGGGN